MMSVEKHDFLIHSKAPIRICDLGGWTDTWFAEYGRVFNIGVSPFAEAQIAARNVEMGKGRIVIHVENFGESYTFDLRQNSSALGWNRHPLLEAAIEYMRPPDDLDLEITIRSQAPAGAATGTSAAVTVALLGGLDALTPGRMSPHQIAEAAWKVETELLGQQCGVQDQLCSAYGGINYIEIDHYPHASVAQLQLSEKIQRELEQRLVLVYLGRSHASSQVHEMVIEAMEGLGPENRFLESLRATAPVARDAVIAGDLTALGQAMIENNRAQRELHNRLVSTEADQVIEIARAHGAVGWKVNGAGGEGGSLTLLCSDRSDVKHSMIREIEAENVEFQNLPISLCHRGLRVWRAIK
jgi:D-glycero-alpha-D-manno-heptose-7-phosphate kinase